MTAIKDTKHSPKGMALITVIIIVLILTILSSVMLSLLSNQTRYIEHNISRTKAKYAAEATMVRELDKLRLDNLTSGSSHQVSGRYDNEAEYFAVNINRGSNIPSGSFSSTTQLNLSTDYAVLGP